MTIQELSQCFRLTKLLRRDEEMLRSLRAAAHPGAQALTGMPLSSDVRDKVGDLAVEITELEEKIAELKRELAEARVWIGDWIDTIEDDRTRLVFRLRFLRCLTWGEVAAAVGGGNSISNCRMIVKRFLEKS